MLIDVSERSNRITRIRIFWIVNSKTYTINKINLIQLIGLIVVSQSSQKKGAIYCFDNLFSKLTIQKVF